MAYIAQELGEQIEVGHNNREFSFSKRDSNEVELVFVKTKFRKSSIVTSDYQSVSDIPSEVKEVLSDEGYTVVAVNGTNHEE